MRVGVAVAQIKILAVGDSMAEFMGETLESFCGNSKVYNAGVGGTTAIQWASYSKDDIAACGSDWDVVYISVGGNDFLESGCTMEANELKNRIDGAVSNIVQNIAPGATKYVLTGYCTPSAPEDDLIDSDCNNPSNYEAMWTAIGSISADHIGLTPTSSLEVYDSSFLCGGTANSFSNQDYFQDSIHLNTKGYCLVFSQPSVQSAMLCSKESESSCNELQGGEFFGLENNCFDNDDDSSGSSLVMVKTLFLLIGLTMLLI